jgi:hypothetical protein
VSTTYLSACLCFKNAGSYLSEWLAFYTVLGVEHFYLYDNESADAFERSLEPFRSRGMVTLVRYPGRGVQRAMYEHCLRTNGRRTRWMLFCDDDEFLFPANDHTLPEALVPYERYAGVGVAWAMYGSSGHVMRPPGLVIQNYLRRAALPDPHVKCIVNPEKVVEPVLAAHQFRCRGGLVVDEKFHPLRGPFASLPTIDVLRINHYCTKSRDELRERRSGVQVNTGQMSPLSFDDWVQLDETYNDVEDPIALRYFDRVLELIGSA